MIEVENSHTFFIFTFSIYNFLHFHLHHLQTVRGPWCLKKARTQTQMPNAQMSFGRFLFFVIPFVRFVQLTSTLFRSGCGSSVCVCVSFPFKYVKKKRVEDSDAQLWIIFFLLFQSGLWLNLIKASTAPFPVRKLTNGLLFLYANCQIVPTPNIAYGKMKRRTEKNGIHLLCSRLRRR